MEFLLPDDTKDKLLTPTLRRNLKDDTEYACLRYPGDNLHILLWHASKTEHPVFHTT